jgi:hypothetical protein
MFTVSGQRRWFKKISHANCGALLQLRSAKDSQNSVISVKLSALWRTSAKME